MWLSSTLQVFGRTLANIWPNERPASVEAFCLVKFCQLGLHEISFDGVLNEMLIAALVLR
jgi:hypothetical protein